jgi:REP element-mobilizing transposase RayT
MSYTNLKYHIVFATKDRRPFLAPEVMKRLIEYIGGILRELGGQMLSANGPADHIHLATILNQKLCLMDVVKKIKCNSSAWLHNAFLDLKDFAWQDGYAAFTVSHSAIDQVLEYIANQTDHHKKMTFQEELIGLLDRHGIQYDAKYLCA